jgi:hypothetical protein
MSGRPFFRITLKVGADNCRNQAFTLIAAAKSSLVVSTCAIAKASQLLGTQPPRRAFARDQREFQRCQDGWADTVESEAAASPFHRLPTRLLPRRSVLFQPLFAWPPF